MRLSVWSLEWRIALRRRRLLVLNLGIPLLLVVPIAFSTAPAFHAAAAYAVLFVLFGVFGSSIPLLREGEEGLLRRMVLTGSPEAPLLVQRLTAGAALDTVQLLPALTIILWSGGAPRSVWALAFLLLPPTLWVTNLLGAWVAAAARSLAEGALFAAVTGLFLLHGSGVFRTPVEGEFSALLESMLPFGPMHRVLLAGASGGPPPPGWAGGLLQPLGFVLVLLTFTWLLAPTLLSRIAPAVRR